MDHFISQKTVERIKTFNKDRDWLQFHSPENLAKSISIEAGELLECFQWDSSYDIGSVKEELADVLIYCIDMRSVLNLNAEEIINEKISLNESKYPIRLSKGSSDKYTTFSKESK